MRRWPYVLLLATSLLIAAVGRDLSAPTSRPRTFGRSKTPAADAGPGRAHLRCEGIAADAATGPAPRTACPLS